MWKYVTRRIRDALEKSVNHFDKRSSTGVVNSAGNSSLSDQNKHSGTPSCWLSSSKCWKSFYNDNNTNSNKWNFDDLNRSWINAITWSSALVVGWYTSQLIHLKHKYICKDRQKRCQSTNCLFSSLHPYIDYISKSATSLNSSQTIEKAIAHIPFHLQLISNEQNGVKDKVSSSSDCNSSSNSSDDDLGEVLNSIENRLGLAAIENGHHHDGLNLLRWPFYHHIFQLLTIFPHLLKVYPRLATLNVMAVHGSAANRKHAPALFNLGLCYETGLGVAIDEKMAMELYRLAAAQQHPGALYNLGIYYGQGRGGLTRDTAIAKRLLRLAAVQGQQDAITALKGFGDDVTEPIFPKYDEDKWTSSSVYSPNENIIPTQSVLFVENNLNGRNFNFVY